VAFILILVLWGLLAIVGYRACVSNGYPEWAAFLGALCLGPLAPLLALVKREGKRCAFCQSHIHQLATVCPRCTREQPHPDSAPEEPVGPMTAEVRARGRAEAVERAAKMKAEEERILAEFQARKREAGH